MYRALPQQECNQGAQGAFSPSPLNLEIFFVYQILFLTSHFIVISNFHLPKAMMTSAEQCWVLRGVKTLRSTTSPSCTLPLTWPIGHVILAGFHKGDGKPGISPPKNKFLPKEHLSVKDTCWCPTIVLCVLNERTPLCKGHLLVSHHNTLCIK